MSCYYPGGAWAAEFYPCDPTAMTSLCCPQGWTCMSDGRCIVTQPETANAANPVGTSYRGTCTNPRWDVTKCGNFCLEDPVNDNSGQLIACGNNKFCCEPDANRGTCNCTTDSGTFSLSGGTVQTIIGVIGLQFTQTPTVIPSFISSATSTTVHTTPATSTVRPPQSPSPSPYVQPAQLKLTTKAKIGLGVGAVLGALLLFAIAYCFWARKTGRNRVAGPWTRKIPSLDATPRPNQPPVDTPYIPKRLASLPPTLEVLEGEGSRHDLSPRQGFARNALPIADGWASF